MTTPSTPERPHHSFLGCLITIAAALLLLAAGEAIWSTVHYLNRPLFHNSFSWHEGDWCYRWRADLWRDPATGTYAVADQPLHIIAVVLVAPDHPAGGAYGHWIPTTTPAGAVFALPSGGRATVDRTPHRLYVIHSDGQVGAVPLTDADFASDTDWLWSHRTGYAAHFAPRIAATRPAVAPSFAPAP